MIMLITGRPGVGKTWWVVHRLMRRYKGRKILANIRGLRLPHIPVENLERQVQEKGIVVILDECQTYLQREKWLFEHLCVHRHYGQDWVLITQTTAALPRRYLGLVEEHWHLSPLAGSSWTIARRYLEAATTRDILKYPVASETFRPTKTDLYISAMHEAGLVRRRVPVRLYAYIAIAAVAASLGLSTLANIGNVLAAHRDIAAGKGGHEQSARPVISARSGTIKPPLPASRGQDKGKGENEKSARSVQEDLQGLCSRKVLTLREEVLFYLHCTRCVLWRDADGAAYADDPATLRDPQCVRWRMFPSVGASEQARTRSPAARERAPRASEASAGAGLVSLTTSGTQGE